VAPTLIASIEFQMSLLLFVALAGYLIAYRINQSAVVGIILAGIVVGPSLLGLVTYTDFVASLAHLGAIVLLFTIGLEFEFKQITSARNFVIAFFGIVIPWLGGFFIARLFDFGFQPSILIGTALTATSIAITANVLKEIGKLQTDVGKAIIGAAVIDDVLALLALTMSEEIVTGTLSTGTILITAGKAVVFIVVGAVVGKILLSKMLAGIDRTRLAQKYPESVFIFAIMTAFLYGMAAQLAGLSAIVGSFLAGVSLAGVNLRHGKTFREGAEHLQIIFASIFFISLGVLLDIHVITPGLLVFIVALTAVAFLTKVIGCGVPAKLYGMGLRDSLAVGVGMVPRGEVAMIVALLGLSQKLISESVYAALVLMSLLTTVIPPLLYRNWLFKLPRDSGAVAPPQSADLDSSQLQT
jgi:Kef-type K+ transport system membrane component KefB